MSDIDDFFNFSKPFTKKEVSGGTCDGRYQAQENKVEAEPDRDTPENTDYANKYERDLKKHLQRVSDEGKMVAQFVIRLNTLRRFSNNNYDKEKSRKVAKDLLMRNTTLAFDEKVNRYRLHRAESVFLTAFKRTQWLCCRARPVAVKRRKCRSTFWMMHVPETYGVTLLLRNHGGAYSLPTTRCVLFPHLI